jgi:hypothetical protein
MKSIEKKSSNKGLIVATILGTILLLIAAAVIVFWDQVRFYLVLAMMYMAAK